MDSKIIEACAKHAHEVNRAYCTSLGDASQAPWGEAPDWQKESVRAGASALLADPSRTPEASHEGWMAHKVADGWTYGPVKDADAKTHPCMVAYADLPPDQRAKDHLFRAAVLGLAAALQEGGA